MPAPDIIFHHYPRSPFAEKVRLAFGLKGVTWRGVVQPRYAPKPQLTALTGGYRRIPVLQIGADIYCDTRCILAELDRRFPTPALYPPDSAGLADMIAGWADRFLFADALGLVFALHGERFSAELHVDRARFTAGQFDGWDSVRSRAKLPALRAHFRAHLAWVEDALGKGQAFLLGPQPSLADFAVYHPLWYASGNLDDTEGLAGHPRLAAWMARVAAIGHGTLAEEITPEAAIAVARAQRPMAAPPVTGAAAGDEASAWRPGDRIVVTPDDWGFDPVAGELIAADRNGMALRRDDAAAGTVVVHFPRVGFVVSRAP